ncbi:MAG: Gfo/Idh/MocA family oxidoreductase [Candidatus Kapabacteria bacterium]|nr:Gfo/Idh/MocA family oxidoreductase [Candidatus Kapabacteria bacterium]MDW8012883.1 Gfo/Idh/MocA family oxidoreductase [Bacteroidota bacterium]
MGNEIGIGLIGCGAIGSSVAEAFAHGEVPGGVLKAVCDRDEGRARAVASLVPMSVKVAASVGELLDGSELHLVVEAASQAAVHEYGKQVLQAGCDFLILSVGAFLEPPGSELPAVAEECGRRLYIPSGGIAGIDGLKAAAF